MSGNEVISLLDSSSSEDEQQLTVSKQQLPVLLSGKRRLPLIAEATNNRVDVSTSSGNAMSEVIDLDDFDDDYAAYRKRAKEQHDHYKHQHNKTSTSHHNNDRSSKREEIAPRKWQPFYLTTVPLLSPSHNRQCLSFADLFATEDNNPILDVVLMNYMVDLAWMMEQAPVLVTCPSVVCLHGSAVDPNLRLDNWHVAKVDLGRETYGTHHSKIALIRFHIGIRIVITTANFIEEDFTYRTQGIFVQDFPLKAATAKKSCAFEDDLLAYLENIHSSTKVEKLLLAAIQRMKAYDYSSADVVLLPSIPGRFQQQYRFNYGIGKLHKALHDANLLTSDAAYHDHDDNADRLALQMSSIGSMGKDAKMVQDLAHLMYFESSHKLLKSTSSSSSKSSSHSSGGKKTQLTHLDIIWPTLKCVQNSLQGYESGGSLPCALRNMYDVQRVQAARHFELSNVQAGFRPFLRQWDGSISGRQRATPHMKCYFRYRLLPAQQVELRWFALTSCNCSQAAWGVFQSNDSQLYIKSFEMGVLFLPDRITTTYRRFSCTPNHHILGVDQLPDSPIDAGYKMVASLNHSDYRTDEVDGKIAVPFPIPFKVPPVSYQSGVDQPWVWDVRFTSPDCLGITKHGTQT